MIDGLSDEPRLIGTPLASIVLASASITRRRLLDGAGVPHIVVPSRVDEDEIKLSLRTGERPAKALPKSWPKPRRFTYRENIRNLWCSAPTRCWNATARPSTNRWPGPMPCPSCRHCAANATT